MIEDGFDAPHRALIGASRAAPAARAVSWISAVTRLAQFDKRDETRAAMAQAAGALERLERAGRAMVEALETSVLPTLDSVIAQADSMSADRRVSASLRSRIAGLKADSQSVRALLADLSGASATPLAAEGDPQPQWDDPEAQQRRAEPSGPLRVLAAEPNGAHQLQLRAALAQIGVTPVFVEDGAALIDAWREESWDLILLDMQSDAIGGAAAARMIRFAELKTGWGRTPIVALGVDPLSPRRRIEDEAHPFDGFVSKPLSGAAIIDAVERAIAIATAQAPFEAAFG